MIGDDVTVTVLGIKGNQEGHRLLSITLVYMLLSAERIHLIEICASFWPDTPKTAKTAENS